MAEFEKLMSDGFAETRRVLAPSNNSAQIIGPARPVTVDAAADTITLAANPFAAGDWLRVNAAVMPGGLLTGRTYYARDVAGNALKLAATAAGAAIDVTTAGTTVTVQAVKTCIFSNVDMQRVLRDSGRMPSYTAIAELTREEAATIGLYPMEAGGARPLCTIAGRTYRRTDIEDDPHDGTVRLHLENYK